MPTVMVTGSREWSNPGLIRKWFVEYTAKNGAGTLIQGDARGVDTMAKVICQGLGWEIRTFTPDWAKYGRSAGVQRNVLMLVACEEAGGRVVAFWDGTSKGTKHAIEGALKLGLPHTVIKWKGIF